MQFLKLLNMVFVEKFIKEIVINYFRFFQKLTKYNIFNFVYQHLIKYQNIFSIDSTIIFNNNSNEKISKIPNYTKKKI